MTVGSNKTLGFVGVLLMVLGSVSQFLSLEQVFYPLGNLGFSGFGALFSVLGFVGLILFIIAMYGLSKDYGDSSIFNNVLYGLLSSIIGAVAAAGLAVALVFSQLSSIFSSFNPTDFSSSYMSEIVRNFIGYLLPIFVVGTIVALIQALFYMRAFNRLASKSGVHLFNTAGRLLIAGAALGVAMVCVGVLLVSAASVPSSIIIYLPLVGGVVSFVAWILATTAFHSMKAPAEEKQPWRSPQAYAPAYGQVRYCPYCGAQNRAEAAFCKQCGKKL